MAEFPDQVVVVGGGLAGLSAAHQVVACGGNVLLLDRAASLGGSSAKAASGISGSGTKTQAASNSADAASLFLADVIGNGAKNLELAKILCESSGAAVDWLADEFDLDLSTLCRLGGHTEPRTHRGADRMPGLEITSKLAQMLERFEKSERARIVLKAEVLELLLEDDAVVGCRYSSCGLLTEAHGPVILATGGFGADFSTGSLLAKYRPDLLHLPTTSGEFSRGDGIRMGESVGAKTLDLNWIEVHMALVKPDDPDALVKFVAADILCSAGGLLVDSEGDRFVDETGPCGEIVRRMWKRRGPFRLCLNEAASTETLSHCKYYIWRGLMQRFESGADLATHMRVPLEKFVQVHDAHHEAAVRTKVDPNGGPFPSSPSENSWDDVSATEGKGKRYFSNTLQGRAVSSEPFHVAIVTPAVHCCVGGLQITSDAEVVGEFGTICGLYAAGEVTGGVHGESCLGGCSLLDCVVFGRVAGRNSCEKFIFDDATSRSGSSIV